MSDLALATSVDDSPSGRKFWPTARCTFASGHLAAKKWKSLWSPEPRKPSLS